MTSQKRTDQEHELLLALIAGSDSPMAADMGRHDAIYSLLDRTAAIADMLAIGDFPGMKCVPPALPYLSLPGASA